MSAMLLTGCSVEKNTSSSRFYHALISKYNIYFNGNEAYKKGVAKVKAANRDDYTNLLPVFEYSSPESATTCTGEMDRAIQKASKVIALHSITAKPDKTKKGEPSEKDEAFMNQKEYNVWVDDSYLLMAKAQFYEKKFPEARTTLAYLKELSTDNEILSEAEIWSARIFIEEKNYLLASRTLDAVPGKEKMSQRLNGMYYRTLSDVLIRQKKYTEAIPALENTIKNTADKNTRVRLTYLLAQVCEKNGDDINSTRYFKQVIKMKPPYELVFNAGINLAGVTDISSESNASDLKKILDKMLNDVKNKDYLDQIYFALGELARRQGNTTEALDNYMKSAHHSTSNMQQKGKSYLALGQYYYDRQDYVKASGYYDSTMACINETFPDYSDIRKTNNSLKEFSGFHNIVVREDSLRRVASMTPAERDRLIEDMIGKVKAKKDQDKLESSRGMSNIGKSYENEQRYQENINAEGSWYFYNQTALAFGRTEFKRRWGTRKLEDNWRRINKARVVMNPEDEEAASGDKGENKTEKGSAPPDETKEFYAKNLPLNDSLLTVSYHKSTTASLNEGTVLASSLKDTTNAVKSLESAIIPQAEDLTKAEAMYRLYLIEKKSNSAESARWSERLLNTYPESEFAKIISDPDFVRKQTEQANLYKALYENAYYSFKKTSYAEAISICDEAMSKYPKNDLAPKFMLLRAMASGGISGEMEYKHGLDSLVTLYPSSPEAARAKEIIAYLKKEKPQIQVVEDTRMAQNIYKADQSQPHYALIIAENPSVNKNQMVFDVVNFNIDNYQDKNYKTEGTVETGKYVAVTVGPFLNAEEAAAYIRSLDTSKVIRGADKAVISVYIISRDNLDQFRTDKSTERYRIFYQSNYGLNK
jgi:tetratricopeptide (TPR) repeat protein